MKIPPIPHRWRLTPRQAVAVQRRLAARVSESPSLGPVRLVAGLDAAYSPREDLCFAAAVVWDVETQRVVEQAVAWHKVRFPYIPGLLSFREAPALLAALRKLRHTPDVLLCDGQGRAHPRRFGIACHLGVICDMPAIGCAKSVLVGTHESPALRRGARAPLREGDEILGAVLRTQTGVRPVFVSVGHRVDLPTCVRVVLACATRFRVPEPIRLADQLVGRVRRQWESGELGGAQVRGPNKITAVPTRQSAAPSTSQRSGRKCSTAQSQSNDAAM